MHGSDFFDQKGENGQSIYSVKLKDIRILSKHFCL